MVSPQAQRHIGMLFANPKDRDKPLADSRRDWEREAAELPLANKSQVRPVIAGGIAAEWVEVRGADAGRVLLFLHGGGYNSGSAITHRKLASHLAEVTGLRVLVPNYRLAPEHPFPAGVDDALAVYGWLRGQGLEPDEIVAGGDSAGGGLTLSLLLRLRQRGDTMPKAAVLLSPWTDLTVSSPSYTELQKLDPSISQERLRRSGLWYAGSGDPADPMASPLFADLSGVPPLLIHVGGHETMLDDSRIFAERARAAGVDVSYRMWPGLWHVFHHQHPDVPEATEALQEIGAFVRSRFQQAAA